MVALPGNRADGFRYHHLRLMIVLTPLYLWLAHGLATVLSPILSLHDAARLTSGLLVGVSLGLVALTARSLYGSNAVWPAVLALMGCMGLLVPAHEINAYTAQFAAIALFAYGLSRMLSQPLRGGGLAGLGLTGLFLSVWRCGAACDKTPSLRSVIVLRKDGKSGVNSRGSGREHSENT